MGHAHGCSTQGFNSLGLGAWTHWRLWGAAPLAWCGPAHPAGWQKAKTIRHLRTATATFGPNSPAWGAGHAPFPLANSQGFRSVTRKASATRLP